MTDLTDDVARVLLRAGEADVLASLSGLVRDGRISASSARRLWTAYRAAESAEPYAEHQVTRKSTSELCDRALCSTNHRLGAALDGIPGGNPADMRNNVPSITRYVPEGSPGPLWTTRGGWVSPQK